MAKIHRNTSILLILLIVVSSCFHVSNVVGFHTATPESPESGGKDDTENATIRLELEPCKKNETKDVSIGEGTSNSSVTVISKEQSAVIDQAEADEIDEDLGLGTRSFLSSKRKNKITDNHFKIKEKKVSKPADPADPDSKITMGDLHDELDDWEPSDEMKKNYPYYLAGYDNEDRPLWIAEYGRFNIRQMIERGPESTALLEKYTKQCAYRIVKSIRDRDNEVGDVSATSVILDLDGLSLYQLTHPPTLVFVLRLVRIYADLVDECVENVVIINVNYIAETLINLVRPLFGRVMEKVDIYGTQATKWRPALRQLFPLESIPTWYGGSQSFKPIKVYG